MAILIRIPGPLRKYTDRKLVVEVAASSVGEALERLLSSFPVLSRHLFTSTRELRPFINIYVGDQDFRQLDGLLTSIESGTEISIVPSIAGGFY